MIKVAIKWQPSVKEPSCCSISLCSWWRHASSGRHRQHFSKSLLMSAMIHGPCQVIEETQNISEMRLFSSSCTRIFRWSWSGPKNCLAQRMNLASGSWNSSFFGGFMAASDVVFDKTKRGSEMRPIWGLPNFTIGIMVQ